MVGTVQAVKKREKEKEKEEELHIDMDRRGSGASWTVWGLSEAKIQYIMRYKVVGWALEILRKDWSLRRGRENIRGLSGWTSHGRGGSGSGAEAQRG